jgi:hypothetical protein
VPNNQNEPVVDSPWLVIRADPNDRGLRPLPTNAVFWASPDIIVSPTDSLGRVTAGSQVTVTARILNLGLLAAAPVSVSFFVVDPSLGIGPSGASLIGSTMLPSIPAHWMEEVDCPMPWVPAVVNNGHECLVVQCTTPVFDQIEHPFAPTLDRRVAQRNITVLAGQQVQHASTIVVNPFNRALTARVTASTRVVRLRQGERTPALEELLNVLATAGQARLHTREEAVRRFRPGSPFQEMAAAVATLVGDTPRLFSRFEVERVPFDDASLRVEMGEIVPRARPVDVEADITPFVLAGGLLNDAEHPEDPGRTIGTVDLRPGEGCRLRVTVDNANDAHTGRWFVHHLTESVGRMTVGGYTFVVPVR